jgi:hypothetical protein
MGTQVPREEAIFQRERPSEAAIEGFALANTGEVHSLLSLVRVHTRTVSVRVLVPMRTVLVELKIATVRVLFFRK